MGITAILTGTWCTWKLQGTFCQGILHEYCRGRLGRKDAPAIHGDAVTPSCHATGDL